MASLARELRKDLGNKVTAARRIAEEGARKVVESLAVHNSAPWESMSSADRKLRNRLRAHGRQLGDQRDQKGAQSISHLVSEVAYEHWHGMLFARFLAENDLLLMPGTTTAISLEEVEEIAREEKRDWLAVVSEYAEKMLPQIFRSGDPALEVVLPRETRNDLEEIIRGLDQDVFTASDSLGWVYQFWQADRKDEVNESGNKVGADELPAVTQLFTEDYMVDFLLDNTLGAWHAGKFLVTNPSLAETAESEDELRRAVALPGCPWTYLRFIKKAGRWLPAAGTFGAWPKTADKLRCLDPCMGSGHFIVGMFERLVALLMAELTIDKASAVAAVIRENLFGLEIDPRCTQIAAFNLALAAWRHIGHCALPPMNIACSGLAPNVRIEEWLKLADTNDRLRRGMERLYALFKDGPILGSLIGPRVTAGDLLEADFHELEPLLELALRQETKDDEAVQEMTVAARGLAHAAEILASQFTLVATNVPYLTVSKHDDVLREYGLRHYPDSRHDLATMFVERYLPAATTIAVVSPQNWLFLPRYKQFRQTVLRDETWHFVGRLGAGAFETISGEVVKAVLIGLSRSLPDIPTNFVAMDASEATAPSEKADVLLKGGLQLLSQKGQLDNPDARIVLQNVGDERLLMEYAESRHGIRTADGFRFLRSFWEFPKLDPNWVPEQGTVKRTVDFGGREQVVFWESGQGALRDFADRGLASIQGGDAWGKEGLTVSLIGDLPVTRYAGDFFDNNCAALWPKDPSDIAPIWAFCSSPEFSEHVRAIDQQLKVTSATLLKVPFNRDRWRAVATERYPKGLPKPQSTDPTQWIFDGQTKGSDEPLQAAVAKLLGYAWPRQTGANFMGCLPLEFARSVPDHDGIVCISAHAGTRSAADRLRDSLGSAWGSKEWKSSVLEGLLTQVGYGGKTLDDWLQDGFFEQHCALFQSRPFIWHIWDGRRDGFSALVNYHRLAGADGEGLRTLDKLIYTYLGAWIERQENDQKSDGAEGRLAASRHLKSELEKIRKGESPFDLFVRWKPLAGQPIGWNPDLNDGVRINIRPFMTARPLGAKARTACILRNTPRISWGKDRGNEPQRSKSEYPWFWKWNGLIENFTGGSEFDGVRWNDLHYSLAAKQKAASTKDAA